MAAMKTIELEDGESLTVRIVHKGQQTARHTLYAAGNGLLAYFSGGPSSGDVSSRPEDLPSHVGAARTETKVRDRSV